VVLAARGLRDMDNGLQKVQDEAERKRAMRQAWKVHGESVALAIVLAAVVAVL